MRSDDQDDGSHMMMDIFYREENFDSFVRKLLPHIDPSNSFQLESNENGTNDETVVPREVIEDEDTEGESIDHETNPVELVEEETSEELYSDHDVDSNHDAGGTEPLDNSVNSDRESHFLEENGLHISSIRGLYNLNF